MALDPAASPYDDVLWVYITTPDVLVAKALARDMVEEGLAACANIIPIMDSIYRWQGRVEESQESVLILKTVRARFDALSARVKEKHPYECPCIIALPLAGGLSDYLRWIRAEASGAPLS